MYWHKERHFLIVSRQKERKKERKGVTEDYHILSSLLHSLRSKTNRVGGVFFVFPRRNLPIIHPFSLIICSQTCCPPLCFQRRKGTRDFLPHPNLPWGCWASEWGLTSLSSASSSFALAFFSWINFPRQDEKERRRKRNWTEEWHQSKGRNFNCGLKEQETEMKSLNLESRWRMNSVWLFTRLCFAIRDPMACAPKGSFNTSKCKNSLDSWNRF